MIKNWFSSLPPGLRLRLQLLRRFFRDIFSGARLRMVSRAGARAQLPIQRSLEQRVTGGATHAAKMHNMRKAIARLEMLKIPSGGLLSFWQIVGNPGRKQGFLPGRNIKDGQLVEDFGGGLCQMSSAMYELALRCGMAIEERHAHSTNVYTPETAYTTLGLDATLAYGYKDLRLRNTFPFPVCFTFELSDTRIAVGLCAPQTLPELSIDIKQLPAEGNALWSEVLLVENGGGRRVSRDFYRAWNPG